MRIIRPASAGTLESSDIYVQIAPGEGIDIRIDSVVKKQFGDAIEASIRDVLARMEVSGAEVYVNDRGALDCTVRARVEAAIMRAGSGAAR